MQLYEGIKQGIEHKEIPEGSLLPATRLLAGALDLSRSTVIKAYELLVMEGYLQSKAGAGYRVLPLMSVPIPISLPRPAAPAYPEMSALGQSFLKNIDLINSTSDRSIAFRPGLPPLDIFPVNQWKKLSNLYWRYIKASSLNYAPSSGLESLKKSIAAYLQMTRNLQCDYRQVIIVSGSLQSLFLIGSVMLNEGDGVVLENPTFPNVHSIFKSLRARLIPMGIDAEGLRVDQMNEATFTGAKLIHVTPSNHYPSGVRMSIARRQELLAWAQDRPVMILENDYEHEVSNWHDPLPALFSLDRQEKTIFMGTFNRLLHPSVRLGYMVVPFHLLAAVEALQKHSHRFVSPSLQTVMHQFIEKKYLIKHVKNVIEVAAERKAVFQQTLQECLGERLSLLPQQAECLHTLVQLPPGQTDKTLVAALERNDLIAHAYSKCFIGTPAIQGLIMGHSSVRTPVIQKTLLRMARLWAGME